SFLLALPPPSHLCTPFPATTLFRSALRTFLWRGPLGKRNDFSKRSNAFSAALGTGVDEPDDRHRRLLRICGKRPRDSHAAEERDKLAPIQLIELHRGIAWGREMIKLSLRLGMPAFVLLVDLNCAAVAQDKLRIAGGLAGTWENSFSELGQNAGFFKKHGLVLEIFYTQGAGETQQAVISGSADIG